jgi:hypothetical protein
MSLIDWSDPEEMFGLLVEYVMDEQNEAGDSNRRRFLSGLKRQLLELQELFVKLPPVDAIKALRAIHRSVAIEFENDPVAEHLEACADELQRIHEHDA